MNKKLQAQVLRIARNVRRQHPFGRNTGTCHQASRKIADRIEDIPKLKWQLLSGYYYRADKHDAHCWLEVWEHGRKKSTRRIVDVTVDQFANKRRKCKSGRRIPAIIFAPRSDWPEYRERLPKKL